MSILDEIVAHKRTELAALPEAEVTVETLRAMASRETLCGSTRLPSSCAV